MENVLLAHNNKRRMHQDTPDLVWDSKLAVEAKDWATQIAKAGGLKHSSSSNYGENLYYQWSSAKIDEKNALEKAVESWYSEIKDYNLRTHKSSGTTGHFTQVVWKSSIKLGVGATSVSQNGGYAVYVVGRYFPPGNYVGEYEKNVKPLK
ncbi:uncharacterized protein LOC105846266 isoform X2 [Hydra vulgaris]|uniref:Uncharacterized protein LOC105846266 isoform X2 n=1 Tax=Hydra vulgaris TaxID=6087 RepID=A0ABM4C6Q7_HYDVU